MDFTEKKNNNNNRTWEGIGQGKTGNDDTNLAIAPN